MDKAKWYVAHTFSGYENKVATDLKNKVENLNLTDMIQEIVIPTETVVEIKDDGTKKEIERKIFSFRMNSPMLSSVSIRTVSHKSTWFIIISTRWYPSSRRPVTSKAKLILAYAFCSRCFISVPF